MKKRERTALQDWQKQDAKRLKVIFNKLRVMSQDAFAARFGLGTQSNVSQYLNGHIALNLEAAIRFSKGLGVPISEFSPTLAGELGNEKVASVQADIVSALRLMRTDLAQDAMDYLVTRLQKSDVANEIVKQYDAKFRELVRQLDLDFGDATAKPKRRRPKT